MSMHSRAVARGLHELADDIATGDRVVDGVKWYFVMDEQATKRIEAGDTLLVPRAIHDAMCPSLAVVIHDEGEEVVVCDRCTLAVENGAA